MRAEHLGRPLVEGTSVEPDFASNRLPHPDEHACKRRLAGAGRTDHAEAAAALELERDVLQHQLGAAGGAPLALSTVRRSRGAGSSIGACSGGSSVRSLFSRCQLCRHAATAFQCAIARSTGASARAAKIDPAMMMPAVASWRITRKAPTPSMADCSTMRSTFETAPRPPTTSLALH